MGKMTKKLARENKKGTQNRVEKSVKKITIIKKKTCITTNKIRTLQIKTNSNETNMHKSKRGKNVHVGCFFVDSPAK